MNKKEALLNSGNILYKTIAIGSVSPMERAKDKTFSGEKKTIFKNESTGTGKTHSFVGTKEMKDRDGDIVMLDGIDFTHYKNNPVVLWGHDSTGTPVGKSNSVILDYKEKEAVFGIQFATTEKGKEIDTLVDEGILNAVSIGFIVKDWKFDERKDAYLFTETELLEISIVNVPANPGALASKAEKKNKSLSAEDVRALISEALEENNKLVVEEEVPATPSVTVDGVPVGTDPTEGVVEPKPEEGVNTPEELLDPTVEPDKAPEDKEDEPSGLDVVANLLRDLLEAVKPKENMETDSQEQENEPKESEQISQQPDVTPSDDINTDEDHSEDSPNSNTEEESDNVNLVNVEDLDEETEFSVII